DRLQVRDAWRQLPARNVTPRSRKRSGLHERRTTMTDNEYTPTLLRVENMYVAARQDLDIITDPEAREEFRRWLAAQKAKWQAEILRWVVDETDYGWAIGASLKHEADRIERGSS